MCYVFGLFAPLSEIFHPVRTKNETTRAIFESECSGVTAHSNVGTRWFRRCGHVMVSIVLARDDTDDVDMHLTSKHCQIVAFKEFGVGIKFYENLKYGLYFHKNDATIRQGKKIQNQKT